VANNFVKLWQHLSFIAELSSAVAPPQDLTRLLKLP
jgi:hypothetical protein